MSSRRCYQYGSLSRKTRKRSGDIWEFRYYETGKDGRRVRRAVTIGTVARFPTRADALRAVQGLRLRINADRNILEPVTVSGLLDRYIAEELPERYSTRISYLAVLNRWVRPKWGDHRIEDLKAVAVEQWLRSLQLAPKSKAHIRSLMHLIYENARRWELIERNPIELVRQGSRRLCIPRVLTADEIVRLLPELQQPYRTMVLVAACLGLRASEIVALQWGDFDWLTLSVLIRRSVVHGRMGETKTEYSRRPVPLDPDLGRILLELREQSPYQGEGDWVFGNADNRPRWQESILSCHIKPAAARAGIGLVGWHTFRHTYSTMLRAIGTDVKVQQELLRHADIATTMNVYTQAVSDAKRDANSRVVRMVMRKPGVPAESTNGPLAAARS